MKRTYPKVGYWQKTTRQTRTGCTHCMGCKKEFGPNERFMLRETQVNWFRGYDKVEYYHPGCVPFSQAGEEGRAE